MGLLDLNRHKQDCGFTTSPLIRFVNYAKVIHRFCEHPPESQENGSFVGNGKAGEMVAPGDIARNETETLTFKTQDA